MPQKGQAYIPLTGEVDQLEKLPQQVVAYGRDLKSGHTLPFHNHRRAQLVYASKGIMKVTTQAASYVVPPQRSVWMPPEVQHRIDAHSDVSMRTLYFDPLLVTNLPSKATILNVSPLLRELIISAVKSGPIYLPNSAEARLMSVITDQIGRLSEVALALPIPSDPRLLQITKSLIEEPGDNQTLDQWSTKVGASKRTLSRLFAAQTGMSFGEWRQQRRLLRAVELLATNESITNIAIELSYDNTSAFIAMFKRCLGTTPAKYISSKNE